MAIANGFKESTQLGSYDLACLGFSYWSRHDSTNRFVHQFETEAGNLINIASCIVGELRKVAGNVQESDRQYFDVLFYSIALKIANKNDLGRLGKMQDPKYRDLNMIYDKAGDRRVWAVWSDSSSIGLKRGTPLLVRAAQTFKASERGVLSVISNNIRV